jgi:hypothetical protein
MPNDDVANADADPWLTRATLKRAGAQKTARNTTQWVEKKVRRHLMRARNRRGFGWKRWSTAGLYDTLGLFADYRVRYLSRA